jgi:hypothetical protein
VAAVLVSDCLAALPEVVLRFQSEAKAPARLQKAAPPPPTEIDSESEAEAEENDLPFVDRAGHRYISSARTPHSGCSRPHIAHMSAYAHHI